jgi:hypothetical protein
MILIIQKLIWMAQRFWAWNLKILKMITILKTMNKKGKKSTWVLNLKQIQIADYAGMMFLILITLYYKFVNAGEVSSLYTFSVWKVGLKQKNIDKSHHIIQVYTGDNFNVKFASLLCLMCLEITIKTIV